MCFHICYRKKDKTAEWRKEEHWPDILTEHEEYEMRVLEQEQSCIHRGRALNRIQVCGCLLCYCLFGLLHSFSK